MIDLLLPATDAGVLVQAVAVAALAGVALYATRRDRELFVFVVGLTTMTFAWFGVRALH